MTTFFSLPRELRDQIYELVLVQQNPLNPYYAKEERKVTPQLLCVNKAIYQEATPLFYAQNCFDFTMYDVKDVSRFVKQIGHNNADWVRYARIDFPIFKNPKDISFYSVRFLTNLGKRFPNFSKLAIRPYYWIPTESILHSSNDSESTIAALNIADTYFKAIPSLPKVLIELLNFEVLTDVRTKMKELGWKVLDE